MIKKISKKKIKKVMLMSISHVCRLQDEFSSLEEEIRRTVEESRIVQEKYRSMYEDSRRDLADKQQQLEELRNKVLLSAYNRSLYKC